MNYFFHFFIEILSVSLAIVLIGYPIFSLFDMKNNKVLIALAITGALTHFIFEITSLNLWYTKNAATSQSY